jgi:hypothetical protein
LKPTGAIGSRKYEAGPAACALAEIFSAAMTLRLFVSH